MESVALALALAVIVASLLHAAHATPIGETPDHGTGERPSGDAAPPSAGNQPTGQ